MGLYAIVSQHIQQRPYPAARPLRPLVAVVVVVPSLDALRHKRKSAANVGILLAALVVVLVVVLALFAFLFSNNSHINPDQNIRQQFAY